MSLSSGDDLTDDPMIVRFLAVALVPVAGLVACYLILGLDSYSSSGILAPIGVAAVAAFLANAIWPVCHSRTRALFYGLPASCVYTIALIFGMPHLFLALEACGGLFIYFLVVGALVGFSGFLGTRLSGRRQTKVISPPADAAVASPTEASQDGASTSTPVRDASKARLRRLRVAAIAGGIVIVAGWMGFRALQPVLQARAAIAAEPVFIPAGEFLMGSYDADSDAYNDEKPQHPVYLDAYWIDRVEVTKSQYQKCVAAGQCRAPGCKVKGTGNYPVGCVSWQDAVDYCAWAGKRLPTEAEWEKAARGTDGRIYPWGNEELDCGRLNFYSYRTHKYCVGRADRALAVGRYPSGASPYGVLDMAGNVSEWVVDWYDSQYYSSSPLRNPTGPATGEQRVVRGGAWFRDEKEVRSARRDAAIPGVQLDSLGFRCAYSE